MKTLKLFGVALLTVLLSVSFSACGSDGDDNGSTASIVGTWLETGKAKSYQAKLVFTGQEASGNVSYLEDDQIIWTGTYNINGSKLTITKSNKTSFESTIKSLTSSTLVLERTESDGDIETKTYKRQ